MSRVDRQEQARAREEEAERRRRRGRRKTRKRALFVHIGGIVPKPHKIPVFAFVSPQVLNPREATLPLLPPFFLSFLKKKGRQTGD